MMAAALLVVGLTACGGKQTNMTNDNTVDQAEGSTTEVDDVVRGELGAFELRGPVKECVWNYGSYEQTYTFDEKGMWATRDGRVPWEEWPSKRDEQGRESEGLAVDTLDDRVGTESGCPGLAVLHHHADHGPSVALDDDNVVQTVGDSDGGHAVVRLEHELTTEGVDDHGTIVEQRGSDV